MNKRQRKKYRKKGGAFGVFVSHMLKSIAAALDIPIKMLKKEIPA